MSVLVRFLVRNDVPHLCGVGQFLHGGDGLGDVEFVEVFDGSSVGSSSPTRLPYRTEDVGGTVSTFSASDLLSRGDGRIPTGRECFHSHVTGICAPADQLTQYRR